jgi:hypothetical protein
MILEDKEVTNFSANYFEPFWKLQETQLV